ncbi:MAG: type I restriction enzyme HsdR N-terminal domain-containing protein [Candidatus Sumerlaeia bacterium]
MGNLSKKSNERIAAGLKRFQPILSAAKARDVNESDTVVIVTDILQDIFGYDKYSEITSEHMIRGTFCDLAVKLNGELALLIEVKAIGLDLKDQFVKQAVDYAANQGVEWVVLTNGCLWRVYRITFSKPIENELVIEFDLLSMNARTTNNIEVLGLLAKEGWQKAFLGDYASQRQALSRFNMAALILSSPVLEILRREVRRLSPEVKIDLEQLKDVLQADVIKREVLEGEKADIARKQVNKIASRALRAVKASTPTKENENELTDAITETVVPEINNQN